MNRVTLLGRVGQDPEVKEFTDNKVCKFSLATSESYKKNGEKVTDTTWHNIIFWGKQCDILKQYVHKGDQLLVEGKIVIRNYKDKSGVEHWATEIVCSSFELLGSKKKEEAPDNKEGQYQKGKVDFPAQSKVSDLPGTIDDGSVPDDNLPF
jgi:single-strand DNA-binding protein